MFYEEAASGSAGKKGVLYLLYIVACIVAVPTVCGFKLVLIPFLAPLVPWAHHLFRATGEASGQPVPPLAEFLWLITAFFGAVGLSAFVWAWLVKAAFRWRRRNSWCFWGHLERARRALELQAPQVRSFLGGGGEAGTALVGYRMGAGQPGFAWLPLCLFTGLIMMVALASLTATGEETLILSFLVAYGLMHLFMLVSGRFHYALGFCGLVGLMFLVIVLGVMRVGAAVPTVFSVGLGLVFLATLVRAWRDWGDVGRPSLVLANGASVFLLADAMAGGKAAALVELDPQRPPTVAEGFEGFRLTAAVAGSGEEVSVVLPMASEVQRLDETAPAAWKGLSSRCRSAESARNELVPTLLGTACLGFVGGTLLMYGLVLGRELVPQIASWNKGEPRGMLAATRTITAWVPVSAAGHAFRAMSAADCELYDEAISSFEAAERWSRGLGQAGSLVAQGRPGFLEFCRGARELQGQVDPKVRPMAYADRYTDLLVQNLPGTGLINRRIYIVQELLRSAWEKSGRSDPAVGKFFVEALTQSGRCARLPAVVDAKTREAWAEEALAVLDRLEAAGAGDVQGLRARLAISRGKHEEAADCLRGAVGAPERLLLASVLRYVGGDEKVALALVEAALVGAPDEGLRFEAAVVRTLWAASAGRAAEARDLLAAATTGADPGRRLVARYLTAMTGEQNGLQEAETVAAVNAALDDGVRSTRSQLPWPEAFLPEDQKYLDALEGLEDLGGPESSKETSDEDVEKAFKSLEECAVTTGSPWAARARTHADKLRERLGDTDER